MQMHTMQLEYFGAYITKTNYFLKIIVTRVKYKPWTQTVTFHKCIVQNQPFIYIYETTFYTTAATKET